VNDPRVEKETSSLAKAGHEVIVLCWDRKRANLETCTCNGVLITRFRLPAPFGKTTLLFLLPAFWSWLLLKLLALDPVVIHACDLDGAIPAFIYKVFKRRSWFVFDVFDRYAMGNIPKKYGVLYYMVSLLEEILASKADLFITVSENFLNTFGKFRIQDSLIVMNVPKLKAVEKVHSKISMKNQGTFRLYVSHLGKEALLAFEAIRGLPNVKLVITGRNFVSYQVAQAVLSSSQVEFHGIIPYEEVLTIESGVDAFLVLYDPSFELSQYRLAGSIRFFEAMSMGTPVITNIWDPLIYNRIYPYIRVEYSKTAIREAVQRLHKMKMTGRSFAKNMPNAFELKNIYSWENAEKKLLNAYDSLISDNIK
jgi:glycosyltransferase involved in cell wall biosynthesis